ncbi:hypothetical protein E6O75_ATG10580 [Venturia nashicola]|uniref:Uncharacterized protein n=1 Tax=Venturia nashicola TaxID=86259 RepID=A0A4Z1P9B3_9PEZI|nr:hypothetical protein E6O75_ATG10580 [Venturia nashicola]
MLTGRHAIRKLHMKLDMVRGAKQIVLKFGPLEKCKWLLGCNIWLGEQRRLSMRQKRTIHTRSLLKPGWNNVETFIRKLEMAAPESEC